MCREYESRSWFKYTGNKSYILANKQGKAKLQKVLEKLAQPKLNIKRKFMFQIRWVQDGWTR